MLYYILLSPSTTDLDCMYAQYTPNKININNSYYFGIQPLTIRCVLYIYFFLYFSGGTNNFASANTYTFLQYTHIA